MKTLIVFVSVILILLTPKNVLGLELVVSGNGDQSTSEIQTDISQTTNIQQTNNSDIQNTVDITSSTGDNETSGNSGEAQISTGDISTDIEVENSSGLSSVESGCCSDPNTQITIEGNGIGSLNQVDFSSSTESTINIFQNANISNNITGYASTGGNTANSNSGNVTIQTGSINVSEDIKTGPVNVYSVSALIGSGNVDIKISGNGSGSVNKVKLLANNSFNLYLTNLANITNVIDWYTNTGGNTANDNLGDVSLNTGSINFDLNLENGPINIGAVKTDCCPEDSDKEPPEESEETPPSGGPDPLPPSTSTPPSTPCPSNCGDGGSSPGEILGAAGQILPATGSYLIYMLTLIAALLFISGLYLRLHPGQDPGKLAFAAA